MASIEQLQRSFNYDESNNLLTALIPVNAATDGIAVPDTASDNYLTFGCGEDLSADSKLSFIIGSADRSLTLTGDASITGTNTGDQNVFSTIAVSGQSNVVADTTSDTLTLVAGSNIVITTDATGDSVTIASTGGGGGGVTSGAWSLDDGASTGQNVWGFDDGDSTT